jgi:PAS domain S-box-containing protein
MEKAIDLALFRAIAEQAPDAIIFADTKGVVRFWNESAKAVFGYSAGEALGRSLDLIIPERLRRAHWDAFQRAIEIGQTRLGRQALATRAVHRDGNKLYVELSFAVVKDMAGTVAGALGVARDITSRYVSDSALRKRLSELEEKLKELPQSGSPVSGFGQGKSG